MKKTKNKLLLIFTSLFVLITAACSHNLTSPTETDDDTYAGIKIKISDIPANAAVRNILINDKQVASNGFTTDADGNVIVSKYVKMTEWGYPFVDAGKTYKVVVSFQDKDYKTIQTSEPVTITAKKGLGELYCPNQEYNIENNILKFPKGSPLVYYGNSKNIGEYPDRVTDEQPSYTLYIYREDWRFQSWNQLGQGINFEYKNNFNFADHLEDKADLTKQYMFNFICSINDKTYGGYDYFIASTSDGKFKLEDKKTQTAKVDLSQFVPSNNQLKNKILKYSLNDINEVFLVFSNNENSEGELTGYMRFYYIQNNKYSILTEMPISYKNGEIKMHDDVYPFLYSAEANWYFICQTFPRITGEDLFSLFGDVHQSTIEITDAEKFILTVYEKNSENEYIISNQYDGTYTIDNGIISFNVSNIATLKGLYDGNTLYLQDGDLIETDSLPNTDTDYQ